MRSYVLAATLTGGMALGIGARHAPWIFLPLAAGGMLVVLFTTQRWLKAEGPFFAAVSVALMSGMTTGWLATSTSFPFRTSLFVFFALVTAAAVTKGIVAFERLDARVHPPGAGIFGLVAMAWIVSVASSAHAGAGGMVDWVIAHLGLSAEAAHSLVLGVRKSIHFTFYGCLGLLAGRTSLAGRTAMAAAPSAWPALGFGLAAALIIASFDELRQTTQPGRSGSVYDVMLDLSGAAVFLAGLYVVSRRRAVRP